MSGVHIAGNLCMCGSYDSVRGYCLLCYGRLSCNLGEERGALTGGRTWVVFMAANDECGWDG